MRRLAVACSMGSIFLISGMLASGRLTRVAADEDPAKPEYYTTRVKPILDENCARCHGGLNRRGGLSLDTRVPGDPAKSLLVKLIRHEGPADDPMPMPPKRPKLSDADIAIVERWVKAGAVMPAQ